MRKQLIQPDEGSASQVWLDVEKLAQVGITSETPACPIEAALLPGRTSGWRASQPGEQIIRLVFDLPQTLQRIRLVFCEEACERTQEFVLRWSADDGQTYREIVRQQYTFSPPGTTHEVEDYQVSLDAVTHLELSIVPDIQGGEVCASLRELRLL